MPSRLTTCFPFTSRSITASSASNIRARDVRARSDALLGTQPPLVWRDARVQPGAQAIFTYAPEEERARRVLSKLRQVPRLIQAARENVKEPPAIFVKVGTRHLARGR